MIYKGDKIAGDLSIVQGKDGEASGWPDFPALAFAH
jgi:hypothetical protein